MKKTSVPIAKERLEALVVSDRIQCKPEEYEMICKELYKTLSKYMAVAEDEMRINITRSEIHIQLAREKVFFDEQLYSLLTLIQETGSVRDACEHMHISYSTSWNLIRTLESQLHEPLVSRSQGGVNGSHSELTPYGEEFLKRYARFSEETRNCSEKIFKNCFRGFFNA